MCTRTHLCLQAVRHSRTCTKIGGVLLAIAARQSRSYRCQVPDVLFAQHAAACPASSQYDHSCTALAPLRATFALAWKCFFCSHQMQLDVNAMVPTMVPTEAQLSAALQETGLQAFRPLQKEAILAVCSGKDCLVIVATGLLRRWHCSAHMTCDQFKCLEEPVLSP